MDQYKEFEGKSTEEALAKAQEHFGLPLGRLEVEVVSAGSSGLFGLMGKKAKIRVRAIADSTKDDLAALAAVVSESHRPRTAPLPAPPAAPPQPEESTEVRSPAPASRPAPPAPAVAPAAPALERPAPASPPAPPKEQPAPAPDPEAEEEETLALEEEREEGGEEAVEDLGVLEEEEEFEEGGQPRPEEDAEVVEHARQVLARLALAMDPQATVSAQVEEGGILLQVNSAEAGTLIGRRGQNLEALQYLVTRMVSHKAGRPVRLSVDAGGYRSRRREALEDLARKAAAKAKSGGRPVAVGPLSSPERRVVHLTLRNEPGVSTASRGRGEMKKVIVSAR